MSQLVDPAITSSPESVDPLPLSAAPVESVLAVRRLATNTEDGIRLKRLGICDGRLIRLVQHGDPLILQVVGCRVGISRHLAEQVWVEPCASDAE